MKQSKNSTIKIITAGIIILLLLTGGLYLSTKMFPFGRHSFGNGGNHSNTRLEPTEPPVPSTVTQLMNTVDQQAALPKDEIPNVATVSDISKLLDQPFFQKAQNGDKVLMYMVAKKAILYRPSLQKIIEVSPLEIITTDATQSAQLSPTLTASQSAQFTGPPLKIKL